MGTSTMSSVIGAVPETVAWYSNWPLSLAVISAVRSCTCKSKLGGSSVDSAWKLGSGVSPAHEPPRRISTRPTAARQQELLLDTRTMLTGGAMHCCNRPSSTPAHAAASRNSCTRSLAVLASSPAVVLWLMQVFATMCRRSWAAMSAALPSVQSMARRKIVSARFSSQRLTPSPASTDRMASSSLAPSPTLTSRRVLRAKRSSLMCPRIGASPVLTICLTPAPMHRYPRQSGSLNWLSNQTKSKFSVIHPSACNRPSADSKTMSSPEIPITPCMSGSSGLVSHLAMSITWHSFMIPGS
mmetsp:Transcript_35232/g.97317  ORF Transcript_35232/g.97317 Transcript_35232/m.97317 type:complete len:298 (+) Transcript_35232:412-1305(+)